MICPKCQKQIANQEGFCPHCGANLKDATPVQENIAKKNNQNSSWWLYLILLIVIGMAVYQIYNTNFHHKPTTKPSNQESQEETIEKDKEEKETIIDENAIFIYQIDQAFRITGRGTVVTGEIQKGEIRVNDEVKLVEEDGSLRTIKIIGIQHGNKEVESAKWGDYSIKLTLEAIEISEIESNQILKK